MDNKLFVQLCKKLVAGYFNAHCEKTDGFTLTEDDIYVVWLCKTLQNNKALLSTTVSDGMYYEITYNGDKDEAYLDVYKKWDNIAFKGEQK